MERLDRQLEFIAEAGRLKGVHRQTMLTDPAGELGRALLAPHYHGDRAGGVRPAGTDLARVAVMLAVHDLVEVDAGDLFVYASDADQARQRATERAAADRIFGLLPPDQADRLRQLWDEFEERTSPEARFARALDRLAPMLENVKSRGGTWREHGISADQVLEKVALIEDGSPELGQFARLIIGRAVRDHILAPGPGRSSGADRLPSAGA
jgi:putative hydrolases of HD superfamily